MGGSWSVWGLALTIGAAACGGEAPTAAKAPTASTAAGEPAATASAGSRQDVTIDEFITRQAEGVQVVDVRSDEEWAEGHVPGAVHVPIDQLRPDHPGLAGVDSGKPVYFICAVGGRSSRATDQMAKAGWQAVNVKGGTQAWVAKGKPLEKP